MVFLNYTPHVINIIYVGETITILPEPEAIRLEQIDGEPEIIGDIAVKNRKYGEGNLPEFNPFVGLIVSQMVAAEFPERSDLFYPGDLVRDDKGNIIGCKNLCRVG